MDLKQLVLSLISQERAVENARRACTELSRMRVVRDEVEIFLAERLRRPDRPVIPPEDPALAAGG